MKKVRDNMINNNIISYPDILNVWLKIKMFVILNFSKL